MFPCSCNNKNLPDSLLSLMKELVNDAVISTYNICNRDTDRVSEIFAKVYGVKDDIEEIAESSDLKNKLIFIRRLFFTPDEAARISMIQRNPEDHEYFAQLMKKFTDSVIETLSYLSVSPVKENRVAPNAVDIGDCEDNAVISERGNYLLGAYQKVVIKKSCSRIRIVAEDWLELIVEKGASDIRIECRNFAIIQLYENARGIVIRGGDNADISLSANVSDCDIIVGQNSNICLHDSSHDNIIFADKGSNIAGSGKFCGNSISQKIV